MLVGGVVALGAITYVASRVAAQQNYPQAAAQPLRTRVGLINLTYVIKNYQKYTTFAEEMKKAFEPFQEKDKSLTKELEALAKQKQDPKTAPDQAERLDQDIKNIQRAIEDNKLNARTLLSKRAGEQMKILYMDIQDRATSYARAHEFDLVLHYNDATTERDYYSYPNIERKLQSGACMPLYASAGMDISKAVVDLLNASAGHAAPAAPSAPAGSPQ
jgi:Skp family chaperone for outer membrane proteins